MKTGLLIITLTLVLHGASGKSTVDHLVPIEPTWSPKFRALLLEKLGQTPFDCGRVVIKPPFTKPEASVSIYSQQSEGGERAYFVTYTVAPENLWDLTNGGDFTKRANRARVRRVDAEIPRETAELLKEVWRRVLQDVRGRFPPEGEAREVIPGDPTMIEFSLQWSKGRPLEGQLNVFLENQRRKVAQLLRLSEDLIAYCQTQRGQRHPIAKRIDQNAKALLESLKAKEKKKGV